MSNSLIPKGLRQYASMQGFIAAAGRLLVECGAYNCSTRHGVLGVHFEGRSGCKSLQKSANIKARRLKMREQTTLHSQKKQSR